MLSNQSLALLMSGSPMGMGMVPELQPDVQGVRKKFQMTNFTMPNNISSMEYALNQSLALLKLGSPMGMGMVLELRQGVSGSGKNFK